MQRVNEYRFYELGQKLARISQYREQTKLKDAYWNLWFARAAVQDLLDDPLSLKVCRPIGQKLIGAIGMVVPPDINEAVNKQPTPEETLDYAGHAIAEALKEFEPVLSSECATMDTYVVSQKRAFQTSDLVERAEAMFSVETIGLLDDQILSDVRSSGRCLAFDVPTAAGFHILRAVEAVMTLYYTHITGKQLKKQHRNWGLYLQKLKKDQRADKKVCGSLEHIKDNYRNPITHPDVLLTEGEAIMLFGLAVSTIELMAEIIRSTVPCLMESAEMMPAEDF